jgi:hypothetical protein
MDSKLVLDDSDLDIVAKWTNKGNNYIAYQDEYGVLCISKYIDKDNHYELLDIDDDNEWKALDKFLDEYLFGMGDDEFG